MIVLAMLTGFNKIGSLERGGPRARQHCVFMNVSVRVCVRARMCVFVHLREEPRINVYFSPANCFLGVFYFIFFAASLCVHTHTVRSIQSEQVVSKNTICWILENVKLTKNINHASDAGPASYFSLCAIIVYMSRCDGVIVYRIVYIWL